MADRVIKFRGEFDASQILTSLKNIRSQMTQAGAKDSLFTGVDKDITNAEKAMKELLAQAQKGFKNSNEIDQFTKKFEKLDLAFSKIGSELNDLNVAENFSKTSPELERIQKELKEIEDKNKDLKKTALELIDPSNKVVFSTQKYRDAIAEAVEKQKDLKKAVEDVYKKQSQTGYNMVNRIFGKMDNDQKADAKTAITDSDLKITLGENQQVSTDFLNKYKEAMSKIIVEGKDVKEVLDQLGKEINEEDKEYAESAQFVEDYAENLQQLAQKAAIAGGVKSGELGHITQGVTKATTLGGYTTAGTFELSSQTAALGELNSAQQQAIALTQQRETEENQLAAEAQRNAAQISAGLTTQRSDQEHAIAVQRENIKATRDQIGAQEQLNGTFDRMQGMIQQLFSLGTAWGTVRRAVQETFQDVQKLDKAFASIAMVTSYSVEEMWGSYDKYAQMANELGQSTESVIQSSALFYQQGLDTAEALELTESTMKLATLAGADFSTATSQMTAALRGFKMEMTEGEHVTDVYSELAAKAAADVNGIAYAMSKTASIASSAGMEFETTAAFLTQMIETTQEAPKFLKIA